jgi:transcriptional regulator with XRE-family HTH domain
MNIGTTLLNLRAAKGLSQGDIEKRTGLLRCYLSRVENGHTVPNLETLRKWAAALNVEMYQLFFESKGKPLAAAQKTTGEIGPEERRLIESFKNLDIKDRRFVVTLLRNMAKSK